VVALWRRPPRARRPGTVPEPEIPVAKAEPGSQQAWCSAPPLRRALSEPVPLVIAPGFTDRLATWRSAAMTVATRPASTWTCLTSLTSPAWTRRRSGRRTSPDIAAAGFAPDVGPVRWRSAPEPGAGLAAATQRPARPPRAIAPPGAAGPGPLAALTRLTSADVQGQAAVTPAADGGARGQTDLAPEVESGPVAGTLRLASAARTPDAARPGRPRTGLGPALPGLPRSARPLAPVDGELLAPTAPGTPSAPGALEDSDRPGMPNRPDLPGMPNRPGPPGGRGSPAGTAPTPADASAYPRAGIGPVLASLPATARPLSPVAGGSPLPLPESPRHSSWPTGTAPTRTAPTRTAPTWTAPPTASGAPDAQLSGQLLPVVHHFEQAGQAGPTAVPTARLAPAPTRGNSLPGGPVPGGPVPAGPVTISSSGQRFASAQLVQPVNAALLAREIAQHHGEELAQAVAPALARLLRPPRNRSAERDESPAELPR